MRTIADLMLRPIAFTLGSALHIDALSMNGSARLICSSSATGSSSFPAWLAGRQSNARLPTFAQAGDAQRRFIFDSIAFKKRAAGLASAFFSRAARRILGDTIPAGGMADSAISNAPMKVIRPDAGSHGAFNAALAKLGIKSV